MASKRSYAGVSEAMLECMKRNGRAAGVVYDPPEGIAGRATTKVPIFGSVVLGYALDPATGVIAYEIESRPGAVPEAMIWARVTQAVEECGGGKEVEG